MEFPRLNNPPIVEAVFTIDIDPNPATKVERAVLEELLPDGEWRDKFHWESKIKFDSATGETMHSAGPRKVLGYSLHAPDSTDSREVVEFEFKRFSYHQLPGYEAFDSCLERVFHYWDFYLRAFGPKQTASISVRFLNSIRIPSVKFEWNEYFKTLLPVSPDWDAMVETTNSLRTEMAVSLPNEIGGRIISQLRPAAARGNMEATLDTTLKKLVSLGASDITALQSAFLSLRPLKNQLFFGSLTPKALALFD